MTIQIDCVVCNLSNNGDALFFSFHIQIKTINSKFIYSGSVQVVEEITCVSITPKVPRIIFHNII